MRVWIDKGYLIQGNEIEGPGGPYTLSLEYQVFELNGEPVEGSYRGEGTLTSANHLVLGDPYTQTTLTEYKVDRQPTSESWDSYAGFKAAIGDRREEKEGKGKKYYGMTHRFWEGYRDGWREKRQNTSKKPSKEPALKAKLLR